jgi:hypothetical protein
VVIVPALMVMMATAPPPTENDDQRNPQQAEPAVVPARCHIHHGVDEQQHDREREDGPDRVRDNPVPQPDGGRRRHGPGGQIGGQRHEIGTCYGCVRGALAFLGLVKGELPTASSLPEPRRDILAFRV